MSDQIPLIFTKKLGALFVANPAAKEAIDALSDGMTVRVKITRSQGNNRRVALYWIVLGIAAPMLSEKCEGDAINDKLLHRILKDRRGLYTTTILPSGEVVKNYDSISFAKMAEPDRAEFISWSFETLSKWLGVTVDDLTREGERESSQR